MRFGWMGGGDSAEKESSSDDLDDRGGSGGAPLRGDLMSASSDELDAIDSERGVSARKLPPPPLPLNERGLLASDSLSELWK